VQGVRPIREFEVVARNLRHAMANYSRSTPQGEVSERPGLLLVNSGVPYAVFNAALPTDSFGGDARAIDECVRNAASHYASRNMPWSCWVCEDFFHEDVRGRSRRMFERLGLQLVAEHQGMVADRIEPPRRPPAALDLRLVGDPETRRDFIRIASAAFHLPPAVARMIYDSESYWQGQVVGWVGYARDKPVSTAATCTVNGAVGVYSVATLREYRGRGYGEWITRRALAEAQRDAGPDRSILQSTQAGRSLYIRMGYRPVGRFAVYISG
jgi:ribosomal protein S18 acetylase RimI-like enzyme